MTAIRFTGLDHCTVLVTDIVSARRFYGEVLGLKEIPAPKEFDFIALWYDLGGQYLHLLLKPEPDAPSPRHFCLRVADVNAARVHLTGQGVVISETVKIAAADRFFIRDPFGNRIEILEWTREYDSEADGLYQV
jgi:catechol 2,3-dioxygenase-like lactoylglutathione lyase family enzyme